MTGKKVLGPLADPDVYKAVVKMARQAIKTKVTDAQKFIEELKLARVKAKLGDLTPEELAKAKQAWEEAKLLEAKEVLFKRTLRSGHTLESLGNDLYRFCNAPPKCFTGRIKLEGEMLDEFIADLEKKEPQTQVDIAESILIGSSGHVNFTEFDPILRQFRAMLGQIKHKDFHRLLQRFRELFPDSLFRAKGDWVELEKILGKRVPWQRGMGPDLILVRNESSELLI